MQNLQSLKVKFSRIVLALFSVSLVFVLMACSLSPSDDTLYIPDDFGVVKKDDTTFAYSQEIRTDQSILMRIVETIRGGGVSSTTFNVHEDFIPAYETLETPPLEMQEFFPPGTYTSIMDSLLYDVESSSMSYASEYYSSPRPDASAAIMYPKSSDVPPDSTLPVILYLRDMGVNNRFSPYTTYGETRFFPTPEFTDAKITPQYGSDIIIAAFLASQGNIVVIPDYLGFGASKSFGTPYMDTKILAEDAMQALEHAPNYLTEVEKSFTMSTADMSILAFGQGALVAAEVYDMVATDTKYVLYDIQTVIIGSGIFNPSTLVSGLLANTNYPRSYLIPFIYQGFAFTGSISETSGALNYLSKSSIFTDTYSALDFEEIFSGQNTQKEVIDSFSTDMTVLLQQNFRDNFASADEFQTFREVLTENKAALINAQDVHLLFAPADEIVPAEQTLEYLEDMEAEGINPVVFPPLTPQNTLASTPLEDFQLDGSFHDGIWFFAAFYALSELMPTR